MSKMVADEVSRVPSSDLHSVHRRRRLGTVLLLLRHTRPLRNLTCGMTTKRRRRRGISWASTLRRQVVLAGIYRRLVPHERV
jgi:hypothetical protein